MNLNAAIVISAVDRTGTVFKQIERNSAVMTSVVQRSVANMNAIGRNMTLGLSLPIGYGMARALKATGDFEQGLRVLEATSGATAGQMEKIRRQAEDLGASTVFSSRQVVDAQNMLIRNGLQVDQVLGGAAAASVNLAAATGADLSDAADIATSAMQNFRIAAGESDRIANQVAGTLIASKFDVNDYALAIGQAGGVVGGAGVSLEDFNAVLAGTSTAFSSGSDAGTSFKTFIGRLVPQSKEAKVAMRELGLEFFNADGSMKSMGEVAEELQESLGNLTDESRQRALNLIFGQDASRTALKMMEMGAKGVQKYREEIGKAVAADQAAARMGGFNGAVEELSGAWETTRDRILLKSGVLADATKLLRETGDGIKILGEQSPELLKFGTYALLAAAGAGPLVWTLGSLAKILTTLGPLMPTLGLVATALGIKAAADNYDEIEKEWLEAAPDRANTPGYRMKTWLDRKHAYEWDKRNDSLGSRSRRYVPAMPGTPPEPVLHPSLMNDNLPRLTAPAGTLPQGASLGQTRDDAVDRSNAYRQWHGVPFEGGMHRAWSGAGPMPGIVATTERTVEAQGRILDGLKGIVESLKWMFRNGVPVPGFGAGPGFAGSLAGTGFDMSGGIGALRDGSLLVPDGKGGLFPLSGGTANPILDMISQSEGTAQRGYNDSFAHQYGGTLTDKTLDEIDQIQRNMRGSSAIGKYQMMRATMQEERRKLGLRGDELFDEAMQDRLAMSRMRYRGYDAWKAGTLSDSGFMANLAHEWAGMTNPYTGRGVYPGQTTGFSISRQQAALQAERRRLTQPSAAALDASEYSRLRKLGSETPGVPDVFSPSFRTKDRLEMGRGEVSVRLKLDKGLTAEATRLKQPENFSLGVGVDKTGEPGWNPPRVRERV